MRIIITWEGRAHLYEDKRVCLDGFEELTEYVQWFISATKKDLGSTRTVLNKFRVDT